MRKHNYTYRSLRDEREKNTEWYTATWEIARPLLVGFCAVLAACGILLTAWQYVYETYVSPPDSKSDAIVPFSVSAGTSLSGVASRLEQAGLIRSKTVFKYYCDFAGYAQKIQTGDYELTAAMSINEIAERLTMGDGNPMVRNITLIPGWTVEDFADALVEQKVLADREQLLSLCRDGSAFKDDYYIAELLSSSKASKRKYVLEGYLAPNTYEVYTTATAEEIVRKLLAQTQRVFSSEQEERAREIGCTVDEMITLASLIEKEAKAQDFAKVSAVFHNRLRQGIPLGSDVTIHYITGVRKMYLTQADLEIDSAYNTYRHAGLPAGPVCNPSADAINAALWPDESFLAEKYLYFCAKEPESGELYFSRTQQEHDQAVAVYAPLWKAYDEERGIQ